MHCFTIKDNAPDQYKRALEALSKRDIALLCELREQDRKSQSAQKTENPEEMTKLRGKPGSKPRHIKTYSRKKSTQEYIAEQQARLQAKRETSMVTEQSS